MMWTIRSYDRARLAVLLVWSFAVGGLTGCGALDVSDPTAIEESEIDNAEGAELLARRTLRALYEVAALAAWESGVLADEFLAQSPTFLVQAGALSPSELLDRRASVEFEEQYPSSSYGPWQELWVRRTPVALEKLKAYAPPEAGAQVGEVFAVRGFVAMRLAEDFCPGFPLHDLVGYRVVHGSPHSTEEALERALATFDTALTWAADSARVLNFARVGRGRTLLNLGRFAEAAAAVADVPDDYIYQTEYSVEIGPRNILAVGTFPFWGDERGVADREGGTGLDFVSAEDPRVPTDSAGLARDGATVLYGLTKYADEAAPIELASGREARLIEAEAALQANDPVTWLAKVNQLRQTIGLADTTDPGTDEARVDLMFRERAFWLFATGHRLGDLRRLIRQYNRTPESVFPTGNYWRGGVYGTGTSIPMPKEEVQFSPGVTGCTSR